MNIQQLLAEGILPLSAFVSKNAPAPATTIPVLPWFLPSKSNSKAYALAIELSFPALE
jgi:hypothetical protein